MDETPAFAAPPPAEHVGDVDSTNPAAPTDDAAPIILGAPPPGAEEGGADPFGAGGADPFGGGEAPAPTGGDFVEVPPVAEGVVEDVEEEDVPPPEPTGPTPMQIWNEQWQDVLKERKDEENKTKAEHVEAARKSTDDFNAEREKKRESRMSKNRADEQEKLEAIEADLENDNSWQRVGKMVELSHDSAQDSADIKRMTDTLILLKNDTTRAVTLS